MRESETGRKIMNPKNSDFTTQELPGRKELLLKGGDEAGKLIEFI